MFKAGKTKVCVRDRFDTPGGHHYHTAPMSGPRAEEVDVSLLAVQGAVLERRYPLSDFNRLRESVVALSEHDAHEVRARFVFAREQGRPVALVDVEASLPLACQRCLRPIEWPVKSSARLAFVGETDGTADDIDEHDAYEMRAGHVTLIEVVEEELLLALPLVATHTAPADCEFLASPVAAPDRAPTAEKSQRPFAGLKELLGRK
jgi:uncharacterized protein